jgi:hypothetical protein
VRKLFSPKWLLMHAFVLVAIAVCLRLALWQWHRAESITGSIQNFGYAIQWPMFATFFAYFWWRSARDTLHPELVKDLPTNQPGIPPSEETAEPVVARTVIPVEDELEDPELAAYNRYLASLYERDHRKVQAR